jgi:hypothetical protein
MNLSEQQLSDLANRGIIAGPQENLERFSARVAKLKNGDLIHNTTFDFSIDWAPIIYSNKKLPFWQGGATWIEEGVPEIQLRSRFLEKKTVLTYSKEEVLQHESVHALRSAFEEPVYEEVLAYMTSPKKWRRYVGPLFRSYKEAALLLGILIFIPLGSILVFALQGFRLFLDLKKYKNTVCTLEKITERPTFFSLFLTDKEIRYFAHLSEERIRQYAADKHCCRWNQLRTLMI